MNAMTKRTPIILVGLLAAGIFIFALNGYLPTPIEGCVALAGILTFLTGMLFGLIGAFRGIATLSSPKLREQTGVYIPFMTILITVLTWYSVITMMIFVKQSLDKRSQIEDEHWDELHQTNAINPNENDTVAAHK